MSEGYSKNFNRENETEINGQHRNIQRLKIRQRKSL